MQKNFRHGLSLGEAVSCDHRTEALPLSEAAYVSVGAAALRLGPDCTVGARACVVCLQKMTGIASLLFFRAYR